MGDFAKVFLGGIISGCFSLAVAWYIFHTENDKVIIKQKHDVLINHLIPDIYTPLLKILDDYNSKK